MHAHSINGTQMQRKTSFVQLVLHQSYLYKLIIYKEFEAK